MPRPELVTPHQATHLVSTTARKTSSYFFDAHPGTEVGFLSVISIEHQPSIHQISSTGRQLNKIKCIEALRNCDVPTQKHYNYGPKKSVVFWRSPSISRHPLRRELACRHSKRDHLVGGDNRPEPIKNGDFAGDRPQT